MVNLNVVLVSAAVGAFIGCLEAAPQGKNQNNEAIQAKVATKFVNYYKPRQQEMGDGMHNVKPMQWVTGGQGGQGWQPSAANTRQAAAQPSNSVKPSITRSRPANVPPEPTTRASQWKSQGATTQRTRTLSGVAAPTQPTQPSNQPAKPQAAGVSGINCELFSKAVAAGGYSQPSNAQCKSFIAGLPVGNIASMTEAAMFLTQIMWESDGLKAKEEYYCKTNDCKSAYGSAKDLPGKVYSGRGYIQLTWADNYDAASRALYGDDRLLQNPEQVSSNEQTAWDVSFWYWKDRVRTNPQVLSGSFGTSTNMINGALECRGGYADKAKKRFEIYKKVLAVMDPSATAIESGCYN